MSLSCATQLLASYSGRDKVLRTLCYTSLCLSGVTKNKDLGQKLAILSSRLSGCRAVLRQFDDLPMLSYTLSYGLGKHEKDRILQILGVVTNLVDQLYFPIEHISWASDVNLITVKNPTFWSNASSIFWCLSLYLTLLSALRKLSLLNGKHAQDLAMRSQIQAEMKSSFLIALQSILDLGHAVNSLPAGWLWSGTMQPWQRGFLGSLSSAISMYRAIKAMRST